MNNYIVTSTNKWEDLFKLDKSFLNSFIYRGQQNSKWDLKTSLERVKNGQDTFLKDYTTEERWMLHEFKRKFHLYSNRQIPDNEKFEWLSIMQHHGAPTRLLDFTSSIFIATYFAVIESSMDGSVWAINRYILRDTLHDEYNLPYEKKQVLKDEVNLHNTYFANQYIARPFSVEKIPTTVVPLDTKLCTERLARQQGLFLMPTNSDESFMKNLESAFKRDNSIFRDVPFEKLIELSKTESRETNIQLIKINIPKKTHSEIAKYLKEMNITSEILFPGLDGLAKSLIHTW
ncbi:MAG: FRG domain-containing protein [Bacteroidota bacterium]